MAGGKGKGKSTRGKGKGKGKQTEVEVVQSDENVPQGGEDWRNLMDDDDSARETSTPVKHAASAASAVDITVHRALLDQMERLNRVALTFLGPL